MIVRDMLVVCFVVVSVGMIQSTSLTFLNGRLHSSGWRTHSTLSLFNNWYSFQIHRSHSLKMDSTDSEAMLENGHMDINEKTQKELDDEIKRRKEKQVFK